MKKLQKLSIAFAIIATFALACSKEKLDTTINPTLSTQSANKEQAKMSEEESADIAKTIKEIEGYKEKFDNWRQGKNTQELIDTKSAGEQIEMIWNYKVSRPGTIFEKYEFVTAVAEVGTKEVKEWTGADAAHAYEAVKEQIVKLYNGIEGSDKGINMIDMGTPSFQNGKLIMYIQMNVGIGTIEDGAMPNAEGRNASDTRWAAGSYGFTNSTPCIGEANKEIAIFVNQKLSFFLKNLPPFSNAPGGNSQTNIASVRIISQIEHVQTNYFKATFPLGGFNLPNSITINTQPLFSETTTAFLTGNTQLPNYPIQGQFKIHADLSGGFSNVPDENCFISQKLSSYQQGNREVGDSYLDKVNLILNATTTTKRRLISTYVGALSFSPFNPLGDGFNKIQEHPTYHFYARVKNLIDVCCVEPELETM